MNDFQRDRVRRFANDEATVSAVKEIIREAFLKPKPEKDIHYLAASRIAIDLLEEAFKEIARSRDEEQNKDKGIKQVGL